MGKGDGQCEKCALGRPFGEERTFASRAEGSGGGGAETLREVWSPAPAFGPCPVVRPVARLAQVFTLLGFRSPGEGLAAAAYPPQRSLCTPETGDAGPGRGVPC